VQVLEYFGKPEKNCGGPVLLELRHLLDARDAASTRRLHLGDRTGREREVLDAALCHQHVVLDADTTKAPETSKNSRVDESSASGVCQCCVEQAVDEVEAWLHLMRGAEASNDEKEGAQNGCTIEWPAHAP
jgi:hypothetical protein